MKSLWTGLIRVGPRSGDHRIAIRAAISVGVPLLVLWGFDRLDLSIYASFGAFAALYGRHAGYRDRIRMQGQAGLVLLASMLVGTALSFSDLADIVRVTGIAVVAAVVTLVAYVWRWHPPGALFAVFAAGTSANIPATGASFVEVLLIGGASVLFALALTTVIAAMRGGLAPTPKQDRPPVGAVAWEMALTVGLGVFLAGLAALLLVGTHWYWAMVGAVAALGGAHVTARVVRGLQRLLGTLAGIFIAAGLLALDLPAIVTILVAVALQACAEMFVGRNYGIAMIFVTPLALLMVELAVPTDPIVLLQDRILDTIIGVVVGTAVAVASAWMRRTARASRG